MSQEIQEVTIRRATTSDAPEIARVHIASWQEAYAGIVPAEYLADLDLESRTEHWTDQLSGEGSETTVWIAEVDGAVHGFAAIGPSRDEDAERRDLEIYATYLDPDYWGRGVARELMRTILAEVPEDARLTLWVPAEAGRARHFYRRHGFSPDGTERTRQVGSGTILEVRYIRG